MNDSEFQVYAEQILLDIEGAIERALPDLEMARTGPVLEITFDDDAQLVINSHHVAKEIWVASRFGAHHFKRVEDAWRDTRTGTPIKAVLEDLLTRHSGQSQISLECMGR